MKNLENTIEVNGRVFDVTYVINDFFVLESNHGNHTGYNRVWKIWDETFKDKYEAMKSLTNHLNDLNQAWDSECENYLSEPCETGEYDLRYFKVVNINELEKTMNGTNSNPSDHIMIDEIIDYNE